MYWISWKRKGKNKVLWKEPGSRKISNFVSENHRVRLFKKGGCLEATWLPFSWKTMSKLTFRFSFIEMKQWLLRSSLWVMTQKQSPPRRKLASTSCTQSIRSQIMFAAERLFISNSSQASLPQVNPCWPSRESTLSGKNHLFYFIRVKYSNSEWMTDSKYPSYNRLSVWAFLCHRKE